MVFAPYEDLSVSPIPDDITIPDLVLNLRFGRRPLSQSNKALFIDAPTGKQVDLATVRERTESLANGLANELGVQVPWNGVVGLFSPNHVFSPPKLVDVD